VFKIGEMSCPQEEAKVYLANYKNLYGNVYGTDLWDGDYDTDSMEQSIKDAAIAHLIQVYALNVYAADQEITLSDAEETAAEEAAQVYYDSLTKQERKFTGASQKDMQKMYEHYALAEKVYAELMGSVDENVSEDEARIMDAYVLFVTDESLAEEIQSKLHDGATFERLASTYNEKDSIRTTFGRGTYDTAVEDVVFQLDNEECSDMIAADGGYYFFQCIDKYDEELSEQNKTKIVEQRQEQVITDVISEQEKKYYSDFNTTLWNKITISDKGQITTNSFFSTFDAV
jgi:foldase protein PrsA